MLNYILFSLTHFANIKLTFDRMLHLVDTCTFSCLRLLKRTENMTSQVYHFSSTNISQVNIIHSMLIEIEIEIEILFPQLE